jgi:Flp pilus assembly protein TadD
VLTLDWTGLWQDGLHAHLDADAFGRTVDVFYAGDWTLELWRQADLDDLAARVRQLPSSELLRAHLWTIARERGDRSVLGALADGDREARARAHVAAGEAAFTAGRARDAAGEFLAAVRLAPTLAAGWNDLAVALHALGRPAAAAEAVACALFAAPADEDALANRDALLAAA